VKSSKGGKECIVEKEKRKKEEKKQKEQHAHYVCDRTKKGKEV